MLRVLRENAWECALAGALALLGASTVFLVLAVMGRDDGPGGAPPAGVGDPAAGATATPRPVKDDRLVVAPALPGTLDAALFRLAGPGESPDLVFAPAAAGQEGAVAVRPFVPIVSPATAITALTRERLDAVLGGAVRDWSEAGGRPGPVTVVRGPAGPFGVPDAWIGVDTTQLASYADVVRAVAGQSHGVALVPLDEVDASVVAVAVDGVDLVRGRGDPSAWPFYERVIVEARTGEGREAIDAVRVVLEPVLPDPVTVVLTGDILQSRCTLDRIRATGDWGAALRTPVGEYLAAADLSLGSLDGAIQDINEPYGCVEITNLSSPPEVIEALTIAGIDGLTVATNHIFDCGRAFCGNRAFLRTLELLDAAGIRTWGGGRNLEEALAPGIFEIGGVRFGVLGFDDVAAYELEATADSPGTAPLDDDYAEERAAGEPSFYRPASELSIERFLARVRDLGSRADVVIVQVQTGTEETHDPSPRSIKALRAAVEAGADLVVGNQAHWVQAVEYGPDAFLAYALGNFIFDQVQSPEMTEGVLLEATFHGSRLVTTRLRPYVIADQYRPEFVDGERGLGILDDIYEASERLAAR